MISAFKKYWSLMLVIVMIFGVCTLFSVRKQGMFVDEIYTYGLSNGFYTPFVTKLTSEDGIGSVITKQQFLDYLTVGEDDGFAVGSVYYNQAKDVHPPLYYWLFNFASSIVRPGFTKWTGLVLDAVIYAIALFVLYKLSMKLFKSPAAAAAAVAVYGLSTIGVSTMLMIRMYVLLMLFSLVLALLIACIIEKPAPLHFPLVSLTILAGLMTQYYFVFYAFFACLFCCVYLLAAKRWRDLIYFAVCALLGVAALLVAFPPFISQLFADALVSGGTAVENITDSGLYASRLITFGKHLRHGLKAAIIIGAGVFVLCLVFCRGIADRLKKGELSFRPLIVICPAFITFIIVAIVSPVDEVRYIYNIAPFFVLGIVWLMYLVEKQLDRRIVTAAVILCALFSCFIIRTVHPDYLYPEHEYYNEAVDVYASSPCVYFDGSHQNGTMTQDTLQLMRFDDVFLTDENISPELLSYIGSHEANDHLVIYVSTSAFWGSGYDPEEIITLICDNTDYSSAERLYNYALSDTYVLTK